MGAPVAVPMAAEAATATAKAEAVVGGAACPPALWVGTRAGVVRVVAAWAVVARETVGWAVFLAAAERLPLSAQTAARVKRATPWEEGKVVAAALAGAVSATSREAKPVALVVEGGGVCYRVVVWAATVVGVEVAAIGRS